MGYAWAPPVMGLVRGEPKLTSRGTPAKHRANGLGIYKEPFEERASDSPTLDRSRSSQNTYWHKSQGVNSGTAAWRELCDDAEEYRVKVRVKGEVRERRLQSDAVIGWAAIFKPPLEMIIALRMTDDDIDQFEEDCLTAMGQIRTKNGNTPICRDNVTDYAVHRDEEGRHRHAFGKPMTKDGRYCGNEIDADYCNRINEEFYKLMRAMPRHWPMDRPDITDWDKAKEDKAYRAERDAKRRGQGKSVTDYRRAKAEDVAKAIKEDAEREAREMLEKAERDAASYERLHTVEAHRERQNAMEDAEDWRYKALEWEAKVKRLEGVYGGLQTAIEADYRTLEGKQAVEGVKALVGAVMPSVARPSIAAAAERVPGALNKLIRERERLDARDAVPGQSSVEGPTV